MTHCSPATVSRGDVIFVNAADIGWRPVSWPACTLSMLISSAVPLDHCCLLELQSSDMQIRLRARIKA